MESFNYRSSTLIGIHYAKDVWYSIGGKMYHNPTVKKVIKESGLCNRAWNTIDYVQHKSSVNLREDTYALRILNQLYDKRMAFIQYEIEEGVLFVVTIDTASIETMLDTGIVFEVCFIMGYNKYNLFTQGLLEDAFQIGTCP
jgi:hypothetical protein